MSKTHMEVELIPFTLKLMLDGSHEYHVAGRDDVVDHWEVVRKEVETDMDADDWTGEIIIHEEREFDDPAEAMAFADELARQHDCDVDEVSA